MNFIFSLLWQTPPVSNENIFFKKIVSTNIKLWRYKDQQADAMFVMYLFPLLSTYNTQLDQLKQTYIQQEHNCDHDPQPIKKYITVKTADELI